MQSSVSLLTSLVLRKHHQSCLSSHAWLKSTPILPQEGGLTTAVLDQREEALSVMRGLLRGSRWSEVKAVGVLFPPCLLKCEEQNSFTESASWGRGAIMPQEKEGSGVARTSLQRGNSATAEAPISYQINRGRNMLHAIDFDLRSPTTPHHTPGVAGFSV